MINLINADIDIKQLQKVPHNIFSYDLGVKLIPSKNENNEVTICCHGYGHSNQIVDVLDSYNVLEGHLIGFNFPDYGITEQTDHHKAAYGTINEILPLLYLLDYYACVLKIPVLNLYGKSAGGGAIINALAFLQNDSADDRLQKLDISPENKKKIINALAHGYIILNCPLKSVDEILAFREQTPELLILTDQFNRNNMNPIDVLPSLDGLTLNIVVHFQKPDEILSNRDDQLFIERLRKANRGNTFAVISSDGGHNAYHKGLWNYYKKLKKNEFK